MIYLCSKNGKHIVRCRGWEIGCPTLSAAWKVIRGIKKWEDLTNE